MRLGLRNAPGVSITATHLRTARNRHNTPDVSCTGEAVRFKKQKRQGRAEPSRDTWRPSSREIYQ